MNEIPDHELFQLLLTLSAITPSFEDSDVPDEYSLSANSTTPCAVGICPPV